MRNNNNNGVNNTELVTYGIIIRASREDIVRINDFLNSLGCKVIYQKSSNLKLYIKEDVY